MLIHRPRRLRLNQFIRELIAEHKLTANDFIYPVFVKDTSSAEAISAMPGIYRNSQDSLLKEIEACLELGIKAFALFPVVDETKKSSDAKESFNPKSLNQETIRNIKKRFPESLLITDIALDPYTDHGHDGLIAEGKVVNDQTVEILSKMALAQAEAGADIVAPSDMMDGRVKAIRESLDKNDFQDTLIMAYTAKYASCLYNPFREALDSLKDSKKPETNIPQDKKTYQMNFANSTEAIRELELDIQEGADIVMVKPASWYGDIIKSFKERSSVPIAAYQVSGEYSMIHAAAEKGWIDKDKAILESLTSIKRAGADLILSYFAKYFVQQDLGS